MQNGNKLYYGDNLEILRNHISDESVDLIYLDPPFNSNANYNVLFAEKSGEKSAAQITAFEDTWHWSIEAEKSFHETVTDGPQKLSDLLQALRIFLGQNDMMAYITMMAPRLVELHCVLKPTGSIFLHCDTTASHYLKLLLDAIFNPVNYINELIWKRYGVHNDVGQGSKAFGRVHDVLFYYSKSKNRTWTQQFVPLREDYIKSTYRYIEAETGRRFRVSPLTAPGGAEKGNPVYEWRGHTRAWRYNQAKMEELEKEGRLYYSKTGYVGKKLYLEESKGIPVQDIWDDIPSLAGAHAERLGYPTQKPESLLERIISASSNEGDTVLDPFCGCGTTITVAEGLRRHWIGIDITHLAIALMRHRLHSAFGSELSEYEVIGDPKDVTSAEALAQQDRYQFEWWAVGLVDARPAHDKKRGADTGIDGYINFFDDNSGKAKKIVVQVKSGHVGASQIRDLKGVLERERAAIGAFVTLKNPTREMVKEAASAGFYEATHYAGREYPRIQILTIEELLSGKKLLYPALKEVTFKQADRKSKSRDKQDVLFKTG